MSRLRRFFRLVIRAPELTARDIDDEIQFHLEARIEQLVREGRSPEEARAEAVRRFAGDRALTDARAALRRSAAAREQRLGARDQLAATWQDVRLALRGMRRAPGFATAVILTLALGLGVNVAIFGVVSGVLLHPIPYVHPERVVQIWSHWTGWPETWLSEPEVADYAALTDVFDRVAPYDEGSANLTGDGQPERVHTALLSAPVLGALGVTPLLGRGFTTEEDRPGAPRVVMLDAALWERRYGGDRSIVGRSVMIDAVPYTVVGVLPREFRLPIEFAGEHAQLYVPLRLGPPSENDRGSHYLYALARLRPGVSREAAERRVNAFLSGIKHDHPDAYGPEFGVTLVPVREQALRQARPMLLVLLGAVGFVLLIACTNVSNLLLSRAEGRQRELAVRSALGAGRGRLVRQLFTEHLVLATLGGALGVALAWQTIRAFATVAPADLPRADLVTVDWRVVTFGAALTVLAALLFGTAPALHALRGPAAESLRQGRGNTSGLARLATRQALVTLEVALAVVSASGAMLMTRSFARLVRVPPGFRPDHVLTARVALPLARYRGKGPAREFFRQALDEVRALPDVRSAGAISALPLTGTLGDWSFTIDGRPTGRDQDTPAADWQVATDGYFEAMRIPILRGRSFTTADRAGSEPVAIVSAATARKYWPGADPLGSRIRLGGTADSVWRRVIGIAADVKHKGLDQETRAEMYLPHSQWPATVPDSAPGAGMRSMSLVVRTSGEPPSLTRALEETVHRHDPDVPLAFVRTMDDVVSAAVATPRFATLLLAGFGVLALALSALGIYGVLSYWTAQRSGEIGIRIALGATPPRVVRLVVMQGLRPAALGLMLGAGAALLGTRVMRSVLFEVSPTDRLAFGTALGLLLVVALLAAVIPARRAARVDPLVALRAD